jgi:predicted metal-dependent HD superfamily phosphohydrolase
MGRSEIDEIMYRSAWLFHPMPLAREHAVNIAEAYDLRSGGHHDASHLLYVLRVLELHHPKAHDLHVVGLALVFHDLIHTPSPGDVLTSAGAAYKTAITLGWDDTRATSIFDAVMSTEHHTPKSSDEELVCDIDLHILGADPEEFMRYEMGVRFEYRHVPILVYLFHRYRAMRDYAHRGKIYHHPGFPEEQARINLRPYTSIWRFIPYAWQLIQASAAK